MKYGMWTVCAAATAVGFWSCASATADALLFDRGLPTANLNNAAGSNRSNVAWADSESSNNPGTYDLPGDDFTLTNAANVTDIRVWIVAGGATAPGYLPSGISLVGGDAGGTMSTISSSYTSQSVTYSDGSIYEGSSGDYWNIYQLDFNVSLSLAAGQKYDFFVNQPYVDTGAGYYANAFLHASNAALSGSTQEGADDNILLLHSDGSVGTWNSQTGVGTSDWNGYPGWDKPSDANVQVFGAAVPLPASVWGGLTLLSGLCVLGGVKRVRCQRA